MTAPWYKNTAIWSTVIALCALILSQLPPINKWLPKPHLTILHSDRIGINNAIGYIGFNLVVTLENQGNTAVNINRIELRLKTPGGVFKTLPAETYTRSRDGVSLPITAIKLSPGAIWSEFVFFNKTPSPKIDEMYNQIKLEISQSIFDVKQKTPREQFQSHQALEADGALVEKALDFFEENFDLEKGKYFVEIAAFIENREKPFIQNSEFTIYEYHVQTIRAQTKDYKYGAGIYFPSSETKQAWVKIEPKNAN